MSEGVRGRIRAPMYFGRDYRCMYVSDLAYALRCYS